MVVASYRPAGLRFSLCSGLAILAALLALALHAQAGHTGAAYVSERISSGESAVWIDAVDGGTRLNNADSYQDISIGFDFPYFAEDVQQVRVGYSGWVKFDFPGPGGVPNTRTSPEPVPRSDTPNAMMAPFWRHYGSYCEDPSDLDSGVWYKSVPGSPSKLVIQWQGMGSIGSGNAECNPPHDTFQIQLQSDGRFFFAWQFADSYGTVWCTYTSVGFEDRNGANFLHGDTNVIEYTPSACASGHIIRSGQAYEFHWNNPPTTVDDTIYSIDGDSVTFDLEEWGVTDADGDTITYTNPAPCSTPSEGDISGTAPDYTFTPASEATPGLQGQWCYNVSDPDNFASTGRITAYLDDTPDAIDDAYTMTEGQTSIDMDVLIGSDGQAGTEDDDVDLYYTAHHIEQVGTLTPTSAGTLELDELTGIFTFTPEATFGGQATFRYRLVEDAPLELQSQPATVTIQVPAPVTPPTVVSTGPIEVDEAINGVFEDEPIDDADLEFADDQSEAQILFTVTDLPDRGTLRVDGTPITGASPAPHFTMADVRAGLLTYRHDGSDPVAQGYAADTFTYAVNDGQGNSGGSHGFSINVLQRNDDPVAGPDFPADVLPGGSAVLEVLNNDSDEEDDAAGTPLRVTSIGSIEPAACVAAPTADGSAIDFDASDIDCVGAVTIQYTLSDSDGAQALGQATLSVTAQPNPDIAFVPSSTVRSGTAVIADGSGSTPQGILNFGLDWVTLPSVPGLVVDGDQVTLVAPSIPDDCAPVQFDFGLRASNDEVPEGITVTRSLTVVPEPVAADVDAEVVIGSVRQIQVLEEACYQSGDVSVTLVDGPSAGSAQWTGSVFTYRHDGSSTVPDSFTYVIDDGLTSNVGTVFVTVVEGTYGGHGRSYVPDRDERARPVAVGPEDQHVLSGQQVLLRGEAQGTHGGSVEYYWALIRGPDVVAEGWESSSLLVWAPVVEGLQPVELVFGFVVVEDGRESFVDEVRVLVHGVNRAPVVSSMVDSVLEGEEVRIELDVTDADEDALRYSWEQVGGPAVSFVPSGPGIFFIAPHLPGLEDHVLLFRAVVSDGITEVVHDVQVDVLNVDEVPVAVFSFQSSGLGVYSFVPVGDLGDASVVWDFGDGVVSRDISPSHAYGEDGEYEVRVVVTRGGVQSQHVETVSVTGASPQEIEDVPEAASFPAWGYGLIALGVLAVLGAGAFVLLRRR